MSTTRQPACSQTTAKAENKKCPSHRALPCGGFCRLTVNRFELSVRPANMKRQLRKHEVKQTPKFLLLTYYFLLSKNPSSEVKK